jgi:hypothetical protein
VNIQEIRSRLAYDSRDPEYQNVTELLKSESDEVVFEALFPVATRSQSAGPAFPAALLLWRRRPKCPLSCDDAIVALLADWEVSIEQVPFYIVSEFGVATVHEAIARVRQRPLSDPQMRLLDTVAYWVNTVGDDATSKQNA